MTTATANPPPPASSSPPPASSSPPPPTDAQRAAQQLVERFPAIMGTDHMLSPEFVRGALAALDFAPPDASEQFLAGAADVLHMAAGAAEMRLRIRQQVADDERRRAAAVEAREALQRSGAEYARAERAKAAERLVRELTAAILAGSYHASYQAELEARYKVTLTAEEMRPFADAQRRYDEGLARREAAAQAARDRVVAAAWRRQ